MPNFPKAPKSAIAGMLVALAIILWFSGYLFLKAENAGVDKRDTGSQEEGFVAYLADSQNNKDPDFVAARTATEQGDIEKSVPLWEKVVKKDEEAGKFATGSGTAHRPQINSKILLAQSYLQYGNYYYKEREFADKAIAILSGSVEDDYGAYGMYFVGYAYEITKRYDDALTWYRKGLKVSTNTEKLKAIFTNQIGHVYDLKWEFDKVYGYYNEAYKLDNTNFQAAANLWRFLVRSWKVPESVPYFEYALHTKDRALKAELYYTLSSVQLELGWRKPDVEKSILYAESSIKSFPDYPMGYLALARWLYMKNDRKYDKEIEENLEKSLKINPNGYYVYEMYALHQFDKWDVFWSLALLAKAREMAVSDVILMANERTSIEQKLSTEAMFLNLVAKVNGTDLTKVLKDRMQKLPDWRQTIEFQLKRTNAGILSNIQDKKEFLDFVESNFKN